MGRPPRGKEKAYTKTQKDDYHGIFFLSRILATFKKANYQAINHVRLLNQKL